jgi:hypothetical protein
MKVGICWEGSKSHRNDAMRSLPRSAVLPLVTVEGVEWVSLAKDAWTPAMGEAGLPNGLEGCEDWMDTARVIEKLDLVITVDTAIAHIAGGLGVPCWVLLAAVPDMRWMLERPDTPWYRSVRLYRQSIAGDWTPVMEHVATDLQQLVYATQLRDAA